MKNKKQPLYIFLHIPKCAGTTIRHRLLENFDEEVLILYEWYNHQPANKKELEPYINSLSKEKKKKIRFIIGHHVYYGIHKSFPDKTPKYITFLRNPIDRAISDYNFQRTMINKGIDEKIHKTFIFRNNKPLSIKKWFDCNQIFQNLMFKFLFTRFFSTKSFLLTENYSLTNNEVNHNDLEKIKKILNKFYFVGIVEKPEDFLFLYHLLSIKKFSGKDNISNMYLTPKQIQEAKKYLSDKLVFDKELYNYALNLNKKFKIKHINFYFIVVYIWFKKIFYYIKEYIVYYIKEFYFFIRRLPYRLTLLPLFQLSAKFKKISPRYAKLVKLFKKITGIP